MTDKYRRQVEVDLASTLAVHWYIAKPKAITIAIQCMYYYCTYVSLHARYYHDRQLVDGVTASFWSKQTVECGKQFTGKSSASMCQVCNIFLHCTLYVCWSPHIFFSKLKNLPHFWTALITLLVLLLTIGWHIFWTCTLICLSKQLCLSKRNFPITEGCAEITKGVSEGNVYKDRHDHS